MQRHSPVLVDIEVVDHIQAVTPELAVEDPVSDLHAGQDAHDVERLPKSVLQMVLCKFLVALNKMFANLRTFPDLEPLALISLLFPFLPFPLALLVVVIAVVSSFLPAIIVPVAITTSTSSYEELMPTFLSSQEMADQIVFEDTLPENVRQLGDDEDERHHVRQPEVVVGHRSIFG